MSYQYKPVEAIPRVFHLNSDEAAAAIQRHEVFDVMRDNRASILSVSHDDELATADDRREAMHRRCMTVVDVCMHSRIFTRMCLDTLSNLFDQLAFRVKTRHPS